MEAKTDASTATILVVEDDPSMRRLLTMVLENAGFNTCPVESGQQALAWLAGHDADIMLLDLAMPQMSGRGLVEKLKACGRFVPFIVVTGWEDHRKVVEMMRLGALDYINKEAETISMLPGTIQRALHQLERTRALEEASTEHQRLTEQLAAEQLRLADLLSSVPGIVWESWHQSDNGDATRSHYVSPYLKQMLGYEVEEWVSQPDFWLQAVHPEDRESVSARKASVISGRGPVIVNFRMVTKDDRLVWVTSQVVAVRDGNGKVIGMRGVTTDVSATYWSERRRDLQHAAIQALSQSSTLPAAAVTILQAVCEGLSWHMGELWQVSPDGCTLRHAASWHPPDTALAQLQSASRSVVFTSGEGLPGHAWAQGCAQWYEDLGIDRRIAQIPRLAEHPQLKSCFAQPVILQGSVVGVFVFYGANVRSTPAAEVAQVFAVLGNQIAQFIQHRRMDLERLRLEGEIIEITEEEKRRIGRDLHDDLCQRLVGVQLISDGLREDLARSYSPHAAAADAIAAHIADAVGCARSLARGLTPVDLDAHGLMTALRKLADNSSELFRIRCLFEPTSEVAVHNPTTATHLYRIVQEAITNAVRHGRAGEVVITLGQDDGRGELTVADNGSGIKDHAKLGMGLRIMRYRANVIGAGFEIYRGDQGGTHVRCHFPLTPPPCEVC